MKGQQQEHGGPCQEAEPFAQQGGASMVQAMESRPDNVRSGDWGNGQAYLLRRLARDAPDVLERVKAAESAPWPDWGSD